MLRQPSWTHPHRSPTGKTWVTLMGCQIQLLGQEQQHVKGLVVFGSSCLRASCSWGNQGGSLNARHSWCLEFSSDTWLCSLFGEFNSYFRCSLFFHSFFCFMEVVLQVGFFISTLLCRPMGPIASLLWLPTHRTPSHALGTLSCGSVGLSCWRRLSPCVLLCAVPSAAAAGQGGWASPRRGHGLAASELPPESTR